MGTQGSEGLPLAGRIIEGDPRERSSSWQVMQSSQRSYERCQSPLGEGMTDSTGRRDSPPSSEVRAAF